MRRRFGRRFLQIEDIDMEHDHLMRILGALGTRAWRVDELPDGVDHDGLAELDEHGFVEFQLQALRSNGDVGPVPMVAAKTGGWFSPRAAPWEGGSLRQVIAYGWDIPETRTLVRLSAEGLRELREWSRQCARAEDGESAQEQTSPDTGLPPLTERQKDCVVALYDLEAFDRDSNKGCGAVAAALGGLDAALLKHPLHELTQLGLAQSVLGSGGGYYLTKDGVRRAKALSDRASH